MHFIKIKVPYLQSTCAIYRLKIKRNYVKKTKEEVINASDMKMKRKSIQWILKLHIIFPSQ